MDDGQRRLRERRDEDDVCVMLEDIHCRDERMKDEDGFVLIRFVLVRGTRVPLGPATQTGVSTILYACLHPVRALDVSSAFCSYSVDDVEILLEPRLYNA